MSKHSFMSGERVVDVAGAAIALGLTLAAYWFALVPVLNQRSLQSSRSAELATIRATAEDERAKQSNTQKAIDRLKVELANCEIRPVSSSSLNTRIMELGELATESGLVVVTIRGEDAKPVSKRIQVPIKVIARGPYFSVARFLKDINVQFRDIAVEKFSAAALRSEKEDAGALTEIDLSWYAVYEGASDVAIAPIP